MTDPLKLLDTIEPALIAPALVRLAARLTIVAQTVHEADGELLAPEQVAQLLHMSRKFVYANARSLGGVRIGRRLRFKKGRVERWLARR